MGFQKPHNSSFCGHYWYYFLDDKGQIFRWWMGGRKGIICSCFPILGPVSWSWLSYLFFFFFFFLSDFFYVSFSRDSCVAGCRIFVANDLGIFLFLWCSFFSCIQTPFLPTCWRYSRLFSSFKDFVSIRFPL